ncbi:MAG: YraN family protein [Alphaproteobacteria bacterium CG_4_10_14_0_8_um_filter_37_21]|nr:MAG: YraN family protein [Alphaproteobacteria bacterium CG_4_10_14_0_8_um_filter_37_21]
MSNAYDIGLKSEVFAKHFLEQKGYTLITERYRAASGEIDIIATKDDFLIFVEVRYRKKKRDAIESITLLKRQRLTTAAQHFIANNSELIKKHPFIRFDVVLLSKDSSIIHHIENAFGETL